MTPSLPQAASRRATRAGRRSRRTRPPRPASRSSASREAAGEHGDRLEPGPLGGLAVPGRVADHHGLAAAGLLHRGHHEVGLGLRGLDVVGRRPVVRELAGVEQVEVVVDLVLLRRAGEHHRVPALLQVLDQLARARERLDLARSARRRARSRPRGCRRPSPPRAARRRALRRAGRRPCRCAGGCARSAAPSRAGGTRGTRRWRGGSWCRRACRRRRGWLRAAFGVPTRGPVPKTGSNNRPGSISAPPKGLSRKADGTRA